MPQSKSVLIGTYRKKLKLSDLQQATAHPLKAEHGIFFDVA